MSQPRHRPATVLILSATFTALLLFAVLAHSRSRENPRVAAARQSKTAAIQALFKTAGIAYPPYQVLVRVFKGEGELEIWARDQARAEFRLIQTYPICYLPGRLGPKRRQGDGQVPEGVYKIVVFNPASAYHLSLGLNYPNPSDRILGDPHHPGSAIFIHGECVSIGCIPIQNDPIEILYLICLDSRQKYRQDPAVHLFPCRFNTGPCQDLLLKTAKGDPTLLAFWNDLQKISAAFEANHQLPKVEIDAQGRYVIK